MSYKFWKRSVEPVQETPTAEAVPEPSPEKGYFETVAAADVTVSTIGEPYIPKVTGPEQAMRLATVYRCTSILSSSIAALPLQVKRKRSGYFSIDENSDMNYLLTISPNIRQTAFELMRNAIIQMVNAGNSYIYPDWRYGELHSLTLLSPGSVSYDKLLNIYLVSDPINNIYKTLECDEIIHLRNMSLDGGYSGVSIIRYASQIMSVSASADAQSLDTYRPGSSYKGFISGNEDSLVGMPNFQDEQLSSVADRVEKELRSGKQIMFLQGDMKFNPLSLSPADIQLLETKKFGVLDICRFYGVHPDKVFAGQSQNYKASEMSQVQFMTDTLQPILRQIENEFFVKLIPRSLAGKYKIEFDLEAFYQTDLESMALHMEKCIQWGVYTVNEWRMKKGLPPVDGGDKAMISCNVAPIDSPKIKGEDIKNENMMQTSQNIPPKNGDNAVA